MPKISDARRDARRNEILEAAQRAFATKGYQRTSMADIIAEAGLSTGAIYGHFEGKRELFTAVARSMLVRRTEDLVQASADGAPPAPAEMLEAVLKGVLAEGIDLRLVVQLWGEATVDPEMRAVVNAAVGELREAFATLLRHWFEEHPEHAPDGVDTTVERVLPVLLGMGQGFIFQSAMLDGFDAQAYLAAVHHVLPH